MSDEQAAPQIDLTTGVDGLDSDGRYQNTPVFDVSSEDFFKNMRAERKRLSFTSSEKPHKFMQGTNYRQPFYIRYTDKNKGPFLSKIK